MNEVDLYNQLQTAGLDLVQCKSARAGKGPFSGQLFTRIKLRDLIQLFMHLEQMQHAGVPMLDYLGDIRDTTENTALRDIMSEIYRDVSEGSALSEAMSKHPKIFNPLYVSLIAAGEETGDLEKSYVYLVKYLKWVDAMRTKIVRAARYPTISLAFITGALVFLLAFIVPQITGFLLNMKIELPFYTVALLATSDFMQQWWIVILSAPPILFFLIKYLCKLSESFAYRVDTMILGVPMIGNLVRKSSVARFCQTFASLFASGIDILGALRSARNTISNLALSEALETVQIKVQNGHPLSEAFNASGEFPSMVIRMVRIGEESGDLTTVLEQVAEFYVRDVDEAVQAMIDMIQPAITVVAGVVLTWMAVGVFGPIYMNLGSFGE